MKIIANGGAITKNTGANTRDAIILGLNTRYIDGFKFKLYLTKDGEVITLSDEVYHFFTEFIGNVDDMELRKLLAYNVGNKIQRQQIVTLKEILTIFGRYNKELILDLTNQGNKNALFTDLVLTEIRGHSNLDIKLETENDEIYNYLESSTSLYPLGRVVREDNLINWEKPADFYDIATNLLGRLNIREKIEMGHIIMIDEVNRQDVFDLIYQEYQDLFNSIYIITSKISNINDDTNLRKEKA